jgi:benzoyl-CoA reductase/2-hydroxyglutaryl-CoA dehydratase subunit BcrC/BadD/HgdB
MNRERFLRRSLAETMKSDDPPFTGRQLLDMKSLISCIPADLKQYETALRMASLCKPAGVHGPGTRVLLTGVPLAHGAEKVMDIIERNGGLVVCQENCSGIKPLMEDVDLKSGDPLPAIAQKFYPLPCSVMTRNDRRFDLLRKLVADFRPHCIIDLVWQACLTYDVESSFVRNLAEKEFGLPYLRIETDYSPSDSTRIAVRVQALFETAKERMK